MITDLGGGGQHGIQGGLIILYTRICLPVRGNIVCIFIFILRKLVVGLISKINCNALCI